MSIPYRIIAFGDMKFKSNQNGPGPGLGPLLGPSWVVLGRSWGAIKSSWVALGGSWGALAALLGTLGNFGCALRCSWVALGCSWVAEGRVFNRFGQDLGPRASRLTPEDVIQNA